MHGIVKNLFKSKQLYTNYKTYYSNIFFNNFFHFRIGFNLVEDYKR